MDNTTKLKTKIVDSVRHREEKLVDTGEKRLDRHSGAGKSTVKKPPPKKGHGGRFTWEGPHPEQENELEAVPALDEGDPNFVDQEQNLAGEEEEEDMVKGEVEVPKVAEDKQGVARVEVDPQLSV